MWEQNYLPVDSLLLSALLAAIPIFVLLGLTTDGSYAMLAGTFGGWLKNSTYYLRAQRYVAGTVYIGLGLAAALTSSTKK